MRAIQLFQSAKFRGLCYVFCCFVHVCASLTWQMDLGDRGTFFWTQILGLCGAWSSWYYAWPVKYLNLTAKCLLNVLFWNCNRCWFPLFCQTEIIMIIRSSEMVSCGSWDTSLTILQWRNKIQFLILDGTFPFRTDTCLAPHAEELLYQIKG